MKLLLDNGLPRSASALLTAVGVETVHVGEIGMSNADDGSILEHAASHGMVVVTLDADFHTLLAWEGASGPSVIRLRLEGLKGPALAAIIERVLQQFSVELNAGAVISVGAHGGEVPPLAVTVSE